MSIALYGEMTLVASTATGLNFYEFASAALREKREVAAWNFGTLSEGKPIKPLSKWPVAGPS
jgi:hypothetical protein